jgi:4-hydroxy-2-oxoheptanedioate aldolase
MVNLLRRLMRRLSHRGPLASLIVVAVAAIAAFAASTTTPSAQQPYLHLNPAIVELAEGKPMIGGQTNDMSLQNCRAMARMDFDYMGVIFNGIDNREQATRVVRYMRYPQQKTSKYQQPPGLRGYAPGNAVFAWGISTAEYERRADVWPLNPEGDLLAIPMIETLEGLKNVDEIAATPGVGAIFIGAAGDLHQWLGVPIDSPEVEAARQTILTSCKAHNVACGITAIAKADVDRRLKEGWKMIRTGQGGG